MTTSNPNETPLFIPVDATLTFYLQEITEILKQDGVTEVCINEPNVLWYEKDNKWYKKNSDKFSASDLEILFNHIASNSNQQITATYPIVSAALETGERVQIIKPPSATSHSLTIRKPSTLNLSLSQLAAYGAFSHVQKVISPSATATTRDTLLQDDVNLLYLLEKRDFEEFFRAAVKSHKNIVVSGATGSGKTTFTKALIQEIDLHERIITIEDVPELIIPQPNHVRLIYSKDARSETKTTPKMLLESCLRMRPDRILLAELRGEEAFYYVRNVNSGHPGSITSIHASSTRQAFDQLMLYIKESEAGNNLSRQDIMQLLSILIDIVVQYHRLPDGRRVVSEIFFDPLAQEKLANHIEG